jgi:hypothetical protein
VHTRRVDLAASGVDLVGPLLNVVYIKCYYYYYYILRLSAKRYDELLAIRLRKPFMDKNPRRPSFAPFLCSPLLIYGS